MSAPLLRADNLSKSFTQSGGRRRAAKRDVYAVHDVSVRLDPGETLAIVGESGAGKSTLGRLLLRLIEPDSGSINFDGTDLMSLSGRALRKQRPRMQMVFQDPYSSLNPKMSVAETLSEPLILHTSMDRNARLDLVEELAERVGIRTDQLGSYPDELSGGQLQRIAVARAIANDPALVVCDEPLSALDLSLRAQVLHLLRDIQRDTGVAYVFITHDLSLVSAIASRVMVMRGGELVEEGQVQDVFSSPSDDYTKELLGAVPTVDPRKRTLREPLPV